MTEQELQAIRDRAEAATKGPWFARSTDDQSFMSAMYVGLDEGDGLRHDNKRGMDADCAEHIDEARVIAITLLQSPRLVGGEDDHWKANTEFIAHAREDVPALVAEVRRLQSVLMEVADQALAK